ncbi:hypothetical protein GCM10025875_08230 [Litorihabitans aurantiacus]|uniref:Uncharacterized protein n=1 Tax=Litorihabitans aurantiacus TaxID=1930061 RepID=A0AA37UUX4_9MICO|nr:hypothetical protein GCM10025875_08230 [Litorihabitans aurantiacus]
MSRAAAIARAGRRSGRRWDTADLEGERAVRVTPSCSGTVTVPEHDGEDRATAGGPAARSAGQSTGKSETATVPA